jgi:HSP20 family protein
MDPSDLLDLVPIDIEETEDAYVVDLDLPNVGEDNVQIELRGNELRIFGEFRYRQRHGILRRQSRRVGEFEYLIALPGDLDPDRVEASLEHGVLQVWAPKADAGSPRRIEVHKKTAGNHKMPQPGSMPKPGAMAQPSAGQAGSSQAGAAQRSS